MTPLIRSALGALLLAAVAAHAHAAGFERVEHVAAGGYSASTDGITVSDTAGDSWVPPRLQVLGAHSVDGLPGLAGFVQSYDAGATLDFLPHGVTLDMHLNQSLDVMTASALHIGSHLQDAFLDLSSVRVRIAAGAGETNGAAVQVTFSGAANALLESDPAVGGAYLGIGLSVMRGDTVLGEYLWDVTQSGSQPLQFGFAGILGEELTFSSFMLSGGGLQGMDLAPSGTPYRLIDTRASLQGALSVTAVPEPGSWALMLAGLALLGRCMRHRRHLNPRT